MSELSQEVVEERQRAASHLLKVVSVEGLRRLSDRLDDHIITGLHLATGATDGPPHELDLFRMRAEADPHGMVWLAQLLIEQASKRSFLKCLSPDTRQQFIDRARALIRYANSRMTSPYS